MIARRGVGPALGALTTALLAACSDAPNAPRGTPGLTLTLHGAATDTVSGKPDTLEAVLNDSKGHPVSGATITFYVPDPGTQVSIGYVGPLSPEEYQFSWPVVTDASGRARGLFRRTTRPSTGWVYAKVESSPATIDSVQVTTTPGNAVSLEIRPADTTMFQGSELTVDPRVLDRFGNVRTGDHATLQALTSGLAVTNAMLTATAPPSRQRYVARFGTLEDTGWISIVPRGTLAVRVLNGNGYAFATMRLDGSLVTYFLPSAPAPHFGASERDMSPSWTPDGLWLVFHDGVMQKSIYRTNTTGTVSKIQFDSPSPSAIDVWPQVSADGEWIWFNSVWAATNESYIYRVHPDGSGLARVSAPSAGPQADTHPSPSPDGRFVVYATDREGSVIDPRLQILEVATGTITSLGINGDWPRWSPAGDWISFGYEGRIYLVRPDGTGLHQLSEPGGNYYPTVAWSPDGKWIVAERYVDPLQLFEVSTGLQLPLYSTSAYVTPAWRPE